MSSICIVYMGGYEIDSFPRMVGVEASQLFTPSDKTIKESNGEFEFKYQINISLLRKRLDKLGFTWGNVESAIEQMKSSNIGHIDSMIKNPIINSNSNYLEEYKHFKKYLIGVSLGQIKSLLKKCLKFEHGFYPDLGKHDLNQSELKLVELLFGRSQLGSEEDYFHQFNTLKIMSNIFKSNDVFEIDYTDLVYGGWYDEDEEPITYGFNQVLKSMTPNSLILNEKIDLEENYNLENKSVKGGNPVSSVKNSFHKYIIGYLNSSGGVIRWGIDDKGIVTGVKLDRQQKDDLKKEFYAFLDNIEPPIDKLRFGLSFLPVIQDGKKIENLYCVECNVPSMENENELFFTTSGKTWVRLDGVTYELKGKRLLEFAKNIFGNYEIFKRTKVKKSNISKKQKAEKLEQYDYQIEESIDEKYDVYSSLIGSFIIEFSEFESELNIKITNQISDRSHDIGYQIIERLSVMDKISLFRKQFLAMETYSNKKVSPMANSLCKKMEEVNTFRNSIAHANWKTLNQDYYVRTKIKSNKRNGEIEFLQMKIDPEEIRRQIFNINQLIDQMDKYVEDMNQLLL